MSHATTTLQEPEAGTERPVPPHARPASPIPPRLSRWLKRTLWPASPIDRVLTIGRALIVCQLGWLMAFSTILWDRDALTNDFATYNQARWLLAHGFFSPFDTTFNNGTPYWRNHGEALMWPLAQLTRLPPHGLLLLYIQDFAVAGMGWVAATWAAEIAHRYNWSERVGAAVTSVVIGLILLNPWIYFAAAWDFHTELLGACFALLAAYNLSRGRTGRAWIWALLGLTAGAVACLFIFAVGLGGLLAGTRRTVAASIAAAALAWILALTFLHGNEGSPLAGAYGYLAGPGSGLTIAQIAQGALTHPGRALAALWSKHVDLWANLGPSGLIGVASPWGLTMALLDLAPSLLFRGTLFAAPSFQNIAAYAFVTIGTMYVLARLAAHPRVVLAMTGAICAISIGWASVWLPRYPSHWLTVTPSGGRAVSSVLRNIPSSAQVVVSQGIAGRFSGRRYIYSLFSPSGDIVPLWGRTVYFVLSPTQGTELSEQNTDAVLAQVANGLKGAACVPGRRRVGIPLAAAAGRTLRRLGWPATFNCRLDLRGACWRTRRVRTPGNVEGRIQWSRRLRGGR